MHAFQLNSNVILNCVIGGVIVRIVQLLSDDIHYDRVCDLGGFWLPIFWRNNVLG